jgi:AraC-like DNA-binding protein
MGVNLHFITNLIQSIVCFTMGSIFLALPVPQKKELFKYRISLKVVAISYFIMTILTLIVILFNVTDNAREHLSFTGITISSSQAFLFTFALITLFNPGIINLKNLFIHLLPILVITILFIVFNQFFGNPVITHYSEVLLYLNNPTLWVRILFYLFYVFQLIFYTWLFLKEEKKYKSQLMNFFSDEVWLTVSWVRIAFFSALSVGFVAMLSYFSPPEYDWVFTLIYAFFYFGFALKYIKYNKIYTIVEPAVNNVKAESPVNPFKNRIKQDWQSLKEQILANQYYLKPGINIEELSQHLGTGRTVLSTLINREEGVNFNAWINTLRVNKAKEYLIRYPDKPLSAIAEMVGYTEHPNFSHQFKIISGESPLAWKKKQLLAAATKKETDGVVK